MVVGELYKVCLEEHSNHYFAVLLRYLIALGLKRLGQAARGFQRAVHGVEQRHISQQRTAVDVALRKKYAAHHHGF
jgi:hypothetical protein